jgi:hypothetical protein
MLTILKALSETRLESSQLSFICGSLVQSRHRD